MVSGSRILSARRKRLRQSLTAVGLCLSLAGCGEPPAEETAIVRPVQYARVAAQGATEERTYSGTAQAEVETDLSFRVGGTLTERPVNVGSIVERGDLIARLDSSDYRVQLDEALAGLARAEAELRNAGANYERTRDLYENQNASRTQLDSARAQAESAEAQHRAATQQVEAARLQVSYTTLSAPDRCTVAETLAEPNQNVSPGQGVVRLNCGQCAELVVSVPETDISRVNTGMPVTASVNALPNVMVSGSVKEVGVAVGTGSTTYLVKITLQQGCQEVRSGMTVDVKFEFPISGAGANLVVPYVAVGEDRSGNFVYVLEPDSDGRLFARKRTVSIGDITGSGIVVNSGLSEGELIATAGVRRLTPDQEVTLLRKPARPLP